MPSRKTLMPSMLESLKAFACVLLIGFALLGKIIIKHMQPTVICERLVKNDRDMLDIEKCIVSELGGENHRCAFFRTIAYIRLRIAALYLPAQAPQTASYSDLQVVLTPSEEGSVVAVKRRFNEPLSRNEETLALEAMETGALTACQKRGRFDA